MTTNPASAAPTHSSIGCESDAATMHIVCNGEPRAIPRETTIARLLDELALSSRQVAVEVNMQLVPRARHAQHTLVDGDRLEIVSLVGGG